MISAGRACSALVYESTCARWRTERAATAVSSATARRSSSTRSRKRSKVTAPISFAATPGCGRHPTNEGGGGGGRGGASAHLLRMRAVADPRQHSRQHIKQRSGVVFVDEVVLLALPRHQVRRRLGHSVCDAVADDGATGPRQPQMKLLGEVLEHVGAVLLAAVLAARRHAAAGGGVRAHTSLHNAATSPATEVGWTIRRRLVFVRDCGAMRGDGRGSLRGQQAWRLPWAWPAAGASTTRVPIINNRYRSSDPFSVHFSTHDAGPAKCW